MSADDLLSNLRASMRKHLGEFADVYMQNKIAVMRKLGDQIAAANSSQDLFEFNKALNDVLLSQDDIDSLNGKFNSLMTTIETYNAKMETIKKLRI